MFKRIDTVFLPVADTHVAVKWYTEKCGLTLRWHDEVNGYAAMDTDDGGTAFTLVRKDHMGEQKPTAHEWFNFYVADAKAVHEQLKENGVDVKELRTDGPVSFFQFVDADGNVLGICSFPE